MAEQQAARAVRRALEAGGREIPADCSCATLVPLVMLSTPDEVSPA